MLKIISNTTTSFWDAGIYDKSIGFCDELLRRFQPRQLDFKKSKDVVEFVENSL
jgi:hypothetical protein